MEQNNRKNQNKEEEIEHLLQIFNEHCRYLFLIE